MRIKLTPTLRNLLCTTAVFTLSSCSNQYAVSTNLDKENFTEYFSASKVTIYANENEIPGPYKVVGVVEGQDCQIKAHHAVPDQVAARTQARQHAFNQNANAIVFTGCADLDHAKLTQLNQSNDSNQCHAMIICYGRAFISQGKK